eukprot:c4290_g1_i2.p1 GENE.c4290_g1_i2~~c4290_g1_i2.p1  ORF type:complete len:183 (+),score=34.14 c4290_g1_i2:692-1240(+)
MVGALEHVGALDVGIIGQASGLEAACRQFISRTPNVTARQLRDSYERCVNLTKEKNKSMQEAYDRIDAYIRQLDSRLVDMERELDEAGTDVDAVTRAQLKRGGKRSLIRTLNHLERGSSTTADPKYCLCKRVAFGEMVACDSEQCKIEWFHFECVGLNATPKGRWLCPQCSQSKKRRHTART